MFSAFRKFDKDKDGALNVGELLNVLREEIPTAKEEDAKWILKMTGMEGAKSLIFADYVKGVAEFGKKGKRSGTK